MHLTITFVWVVYEIIVLVWTEFLTRDLKTWEKIVLVALGIGVAVYGGHSENQDAIFMQSLKSTASETQKDLVATRTDLKATQEKLSKQQEDLRAAQDKLSKQQEFNTGQLDVLGKIGAKELQLLASKTNVSANAGADAVASAAVAKIDDLSRQVAALQKHVETPVIPPDVEARIEDALRAAGPHPARVEILANNQSAFSYGNQWIKILKAARWMQPNDSADTFMPIGGQPPVGLSFQVKGSGIPDGLNIFGKILKANNIPFSSTVTPGMVTDENAFLLVVGGNP